MLGRIQKHAQKRLDFSGDVPIPRRLAACKTFLRLESAMIRMRHEAGASGLSVARARSDMIDVMLSHLFDSAVASYERAHDGHLPAPVALVATGGYGRGEVSPFSDVDIMFLFPARVSAALIKPLQEHLTNEILYVLWDCGLKVGHSTRTIDEVFLQARKDIQSKTSMLEARLIAGSAPLFTNFALAYRTYYTEEAPKDYIAARLADQASRHAKYGDTVFLQEPDVKNGVGGLRDYQNALWMARVKLDIDSIQDLETQNYLRPTELRDFLRAYDFIQRVRNELHFLKKRATDVLDLEAQPLVAEGLGYRQDTMLDRVEHFMRDYYKAAQTLFRVSSTIENRLALTLEKPRTGLIGSFREAVRARRDQRSKRLDGFILRGSELGAESADVFRQDPARLIRVFRHCQSLNAHLDFHLRALIRESLPLITRKITHSPDAITSFKAILDEAGAVYPALSLMHELGVLGRFIPEFDGLTCLVQHEFYHRYTADIHTLNAIRELDQIFTEAEPITLKYREALHETSAPTLLYLILLLHDIGKSRGIQGHAESGVEIARPLLKRLGVSEEAGEMVIFIIKNHLIMGRFWQKRDVDDPNTAAAFAEVIESAEKLRYLYVHTFCDARGTAAGLWSGYKDSLHTALYRSTLDHLILGPAIATHNSQRLEMAFESLVSQKIPDIGDEEITAHFNLLPERYFINTDIPEIALHIRMVHALLQSIGRADSTGALQPVIEWKDDINRSITVVNVVTWDRAGLFYKLAGAFSVAGLSILGAKIISRSDHIAIDTFHVVEPGRGVVQSAQAQETFAKTVEQALVANKDLYPDIVAQAQKHASSRRYGNTPKGNEAVQSSFPPTVDVYHEASMQRTIVEIQARDEIGLLFRLGKTISDHGFDITFARIGTERGIAIDTFYIESATAEPTEDAARLSTLQTALAAIIIPAAPEQVEAV